MTGYFVILAVYVLIMYLVMCYNHLFFGISVILNMLSLSWPFCWNFVFAVIVTYAILFLVYVLGASMTLCCFGFYVIMDLVDFIFFFFSFLFLIFVKGGEGIEILSMFTCIKCLMHEGALKLKGYFVRSFVVC